MKKVLFTLFAGALAVSACNSGDQTEKAKQDSIAAAAAADSILNSAIAADTLSVDTLATDSVK